MKNDRLFDRGQKVCHTQEMKNTRVAWAVALMLGAGIMESHGSITLSDGTIVRLRIDDAERAGEAAVGRGEVTKSGEVDISGAGDQVAGPNDMEFTVTEVIEEGNKGFTTSGKAGLRGAGVEKTEIDKVLTLIAYAAEVEVEEGAEPTLEEGVEPAREAEVASDEDLKLDRIANLKQDGGGRHHAAPEKLVDSGDGEQDTGDHSAPRQAEEEGAAPQVSGELDEALAVDRALVLEGEGSTTAENGVIDHAGDSGADKTEAGVELLEEVEDEAERQSGSEDNAGSLAVDLSREASADLMGRFLDKIKMSPEGRAATKRLREVCGGFTIDFYPSSQEQGGEIAYWGGKDKLIVAFVPHLGRTERSGGGGCGACDGVGGVRGDAFSELRKIVADRLSRANSCFFRAGVLHIAKRVAGLEMESLERRIEHNNKKLEAGTGSLARGVELAVEKSGLEIGMAAIRRDGRAMQKQFSELTGVSFNEAWSILDKSYIDDILNKPIDEDADFARIFNLVAVTAPDTASGAQTMQGIAGDLVFSSRQLGARRDTSDLAMDGLRRARSESDDGRRERVDEDAAGGILLKAQRKELMALAGFLGNAAAAYPPLDFVTLGLSASGGLPPNSEKTAKAIDSWMPVAAGIAAICLVFAVALGVIKKRRGGGD